MEGGRGSGEKEEGKRKEGEKGEKEGLKGGGRSCFLPWADPLAVRALGGRCQCLIVFVLLSFLPAFPTPDHVLLAGSDHAPFMSLSSAQRESKYPGNLI